MVNVISLYSDIPSERNKFKINSFRIIWAVNVNFQCISCNGVIKNSNIAKDLEFYRGFWGKACFYNLYFFLVLTWNSENEMKTKQWKMELNFIYRSRERLIRLKSIDLQINGLWDFFLKHNKHEIMFVLHFFYRFLFVRFLILTCQVNSLHMFQWTIYVHK